MDELMMRAMREWLRENLLIDVQLADKFGPSNDVYVGLRFKGEEHAFVYERIDIPQHESAYRPRQAAPVGQRP